MDFTDDSLDGELRAYCNQWEEGNCGDVNCEFCYNRPERPL